MLKIINFANYRLVDNIFKRLIEFKHNRCTPTLSSFFLTTSSFLSLSLPLSLLPFFIFLAIPLSLTLFALSTSLCQSSSLSLASSFYISTSLTISWFLALLFSLSFSLSSYLSLSLTLSLASTASIYWTLSLSTCTPQPHTHYQVPRVVQSLCGSFAVVVWLLCFFNSTSLRCVAD